MFRFLPLVGAVALAGLLLPGKAMAAPTHHHLHHALHDLKEAVAELEGAKHNFGGHKEQALKDLRHAIIQIDKALAAAGDPFPANFKPNPEFYKDFKDHRHLRRSEHSIEFAIKELKESKASFGEHKEHAIKALEAAHHQVRECIKHIK